MTFVSGLVKKWEWLTVFAGVVTIIGSICSLFAGFSSTKSQAAWQQKVVDSQKQILINAGLINDKVQSATQRLETFSGALRNERDAVEHLTKDVKGGNKQLLRAASHALDAFTGGNTLCIIMPAPDPMIRDNPSFIRLYIENRGENNCYDIHYQVTEAFLQSDNQEELVRKMLHPVAVGYLPVAYGGQYETITDANGHLSPFKASNATATNTRLPLGSYHATVEQRNNEFGESFSFRIINGTTHIAVKVTRTRDGKVLLDEDN